MSGRWIEVGTGVFARRYPVLDQTLGLIIGQERCLVVDTGTDERHGAEFAAAVRALTPLPVTVLITHAHFDHFLGTAAFGDCPVLAHPLCGNEIVERGARQRDEWAAHYRADGDPALAGRIGAARVVPPTAALPDRTELDLGGRLVTLLHPGPGHTDHDVVAHVPDAGVLFAGDLVEQGAPPSVGDDSVPAAWPAALDVLLALTPRVVVPGHGEPVDAAFTAAQRDRLAAEHPG